RELTAEVLVNLHGARGQFFGSDVLDQRPDEGAFLEGGPRRARHRLPASRLSQCQSGLQHGVDKRDTCPGCQKAERVSTTHRTIVPHHPLLSWLASRGPKARWAIAARTETGRYYRA